MSSSRFGQDGERATGCAAGWCGFLLRAFNFILTPALIFIKPPVTAATTFFATQALMVYASGEPEYSADSDTITQPLALAVGLIAGLNEVLNIALTRSVAMYQDRPQQPAIAEQPSSAQILPVPTQPMPSDIESQTLAIDAKEFTYSVYFWKGFDSFLMFNIQASRLFSSFAGYTGVFAFAITMHLLKNNDADENDVISSINKNPWESGTINTAGLLALFSSMFCFKVWNSTVIDRSLKDWWYNPPKRHEQIIQQGCSRNFILMPGLICIVLGPTALALLSTEVGLDFLNKSLFRGAVPKPILDIATGISISSIITIMAITAPPAVYNRLSQTNQPVQLTKLGKFVRCLHFTSVGFYAASITSSAVIKIASLANVNPYNPGLIMGAVLLIGWPSFIYNYLFNMGPIQRLYKVITDMPASASQPLLQPNLVVPAPSKKQPKVPPLNPDKLHAVKSAIVIISQGVTPVDSAINYSGVNDVIPPDGGYGALAATRARSATFFSSSPASRRDGNGSNSPNFNNSPPPQSSPTPTLPALSITRPLVSPFDKVETPKSQETKKSSPLKKVWSTVFVPQPSDNTTKDTSRPSSPSKQQVLVRRGSWPTPLLQPN